MVDKLHMGMLDLCVSDTKSKALLFQQVPPSKHTRQFVDLKEAPPVRALISPARQATILDVLKSHDGYVETPTMTGHFQTCAEAILSLATFCKHISKRIVRNQVMRFASIVLNAKKASRELYGDHKKRLSRELKGYPTEFASNAWYLTEENIRLTEALHGLSIILELVKLIQMSSKNNNDDQWEHVLKYMINQTLDMHKKRHVAYQGKFKSISSGQTPLPNGFGFEHDVQMCNFKDMLNAAFLVTTSKL